MRIRPASIPMDKAARRNTSRGCQRSHIDGESARGKQRATARAQKESDASSIYELLSRANEPSRGKTSQPLELDRANRDLQGEGHGSGQRPKRWRPDRPSSKSAAEGDKSATPATEDDESALATAEGDESTAAAEEGKRRRRIPAGAQNTTAAATEESDGRAQTAATAA
nr:unnamed protein product [Digitaria exilis]